MKHIQILYILFLSIVVCTEIQSQSIIVTSSGDACDTLLVSFSLEPSDMYDTLSSITWNFGDGTTSTGENIPQHLYVSSGVFPVSVLLNSATTLNLSPPVVVNYKPDADFSYNDTIELGNYSYEFQNLPQNIDSLTYSYNWYVDNIQKGSDKGLLFNFGETGVYTVALAVQTNAGCSDSLARNINVTDILEVPNVFTPNMDGYNDYFKVRTNGVNNYEFSVYSKSGVLVYKSEAGIISWDGRSLSGIEMQPGLYYYVIQQVDGEPKLERKGFIQLIK